MRYNATTSSPDDFEIVPDENGEFATIEEAKQYLIDVCKSHISDELNLIKQIRKYEF